MSTYVDTEPASVAFKRLEHGYRTHLPANSFAVIRVDGKGFSAYARRLERPFALGFLREDPMRIDGLLSYAKKVGKIPDKVSTAEGRRQG